MTEAQTQTEEHEIDEVANKAAAIGKELGVVDDTPDYEVIEDKEDERLAKERTPAPKTERKQLTNKEKREIRKKRLAEKFNAKDQEIQQTKAELEELKRWKQDVEGRLTNVDRAKVDDALNQTQGVLAQAQQAYIEAIAEGDGSRSAAALDTMYEAKRRIEQLQPLKQQLDRSSGTQPARTEKRDDGDVIHKAKAWASKNSWYNPEGGDEDSAIAKAISGTLVREGFDPKTEDYWEELSDRLADRGVGKRREEDFNEEEEEEEERKPVVRKRTTPPVGGSNNRGDVTGKTRINLPTAYIQALKDSGKWEDITVRNRMIKRYQDGIKNSAGNQ